MFPSYLNITPSDKFPQFVILDSSFYDTEKVWYETKNGKVLQDYSSEEVVEVYAIPDNVVEIALCPKHDKRQKMALALDTLISGIRMHYSWEFSFCIELFNIIEQHWPGSVVLSTSKLKKSAIQALYAYLSALAHFALHKNHPIKNYELKYDAFRGYQS
jgi:hypothetical protein